MPDDGIRKRCSVISATALGKQLLPGGQASIFLAATAIEKNFGVISDHRGVFPTVKSFCDIVGAECLTSELYFMSAL